MLYSIWVGGVELDHYFTKRTDAEDIAEAWRNIGYKDVVIEEMLIDA